MISLDYVAGLIDGEGYIAVVPNRTVKDVINPSYSPVIKVCMTGEDSRLVLEEIARDHNCLLEAYVRITKGNRAAYTLNIGGKKRVLSFINLLIPYLRVKKQQAILLKEFCELPYEHPKSPRFNPEINERKRELYEEIKDLKRADHLQRLSE
jgi:hypothetical protein